MEIYIVEDDISIINILEDIIESHDLGKVCGDSGGGEPDMEEVLALSRLERRMRMPSIWKSPAVRTTM